jgi:ankyrin repeat protein
MISINLAERAFEGKLTVKEVNQATSQKLDTDRWGYGAEFTVLCYSSYKCAMNVVEAILDKDVNVDGLSSNNVTALMTAADYKKWDIVRLLLRRGANAKLLTTYGNSALHNAARQDAPDSIIEGLIESGADLNIKNNSGNTPGDILRERLEPVTKLTYEQLTIEQVKRATKDLLETSRHPGLGYTPLYWASMECPIEVVQTILDKGVDINQLSGKYNYTALNIAAHQRRWDIVKLLLQKGATVNLSEANDSSELHFAARNGAPIGITKALIDAGADPKMKDCDGKTALDLARDGKYISTASFIEQYISAPIKSANLMV